MISIIASKCLTKTFNHSKKIAKIDAEIINTILIHDDNFDNIKNISYLKFPDLNYIAYFDWKRKQVQHNNQHADPLFMVTHHGKPCVEINIYVSEDIDLSQQRAELIRTGEKPLIIRTLNRDATDYTLDENALHTKLVWSEDKGSHLLIIKTEKPAELVWQRMKNGRFAEERVIIKAGTSKHSIPEMKCGYFGISISTKDLENSVEHKHMLLGEIGLASGQWFLDWRQKNLLSPPVTFENKYRSLLLYAPTSSPISAAELTAIKKDWDEIEVIETGDRALEKDWAGRDSDDDGYAADILALLTDKSIRDHVFWQWIGATVMPHSPPYPGYGIGYSYSHTFNHPRINAKYKALNQKRHILRSMPCSQCPDYIKASCTNMLPRPFDYTRFFDNGQCQLQARLKDTLGREVF